MSNNMARKIRLFALLIGINKYKVPSKDFQPLNGAVPDAQRFETYLEEYFRVPDDQITLLTDENATRSNIIHGLRDLKEDKRIHKDDAIFIFYAGHGTELDPPDKPGWDKEKKIQAIVPYDCDSFDGSGTQVLPIADHFLGALLSEIVQEKGDNITVVLDCCHSASGTRGTTPLNLDVNGTVRSARVKSSVVSLEQLAQGIGSAKEIQTRGSVIAPEFVYRGLGSHILLAACRAGEKAREDRDCGHFSAALLKILKQGPLDALRYCDIIKQPDMKKIQGQNPQCEGLNVHRTLFNAKVLPTLRKSFEVSAGTTEAHNEYIVHGGTVHNINADSQFGVYHKTDISFSKQISTLQVVSLGPFSFKATLAPNAPKFDLTSPKIVAQTRFGTEQEHLQVYIPPNDGLRKIFDELVQDLGSDQAHYFNHIDRVEDFKAAQLRFESSPIAKNNYKFTMSPPIMNPSLQPIITQVVDNFEADQSELPLIFSRIHHFYRELKYRNDRDPNKILPNIDVQVYQLKVDDDDDDDDTFKPDGQNLCDKGVVELNIDKEADESIPYGIKIVNNSKLGLFANVILFNTHDLSISSLATSHIGHTDNSPEIPLEKKKGVLEIGYGNAGYPPISFEIADRSDSGMDIVFLKVYLSTQSVSLAYLPQLSPFEKTRGAKTFERTPTLTWVTKVIPIILRRPKLRVPPCSDA